MIDETNAEYYDAHQAAKYQEAKSMRPGSLVMLRFGEYFEAFGDDAEKLGESLGLTITRRRGVALCGIPVKTHTNYASRIAKAADTWKMDVVLVCGPNKGVGQYRWRTNP